MSEIKYRVANGAPSVSLNKKLYLPGDVLPELTEEQQEQLLKTGAIEKASAKDLADAEKKDAELPEKDADDPDKVPAAQTLTGAGTTTKSSPEAVRAESEKLSAEADAKPATKSTSGQQKPPAK
jgi:hypothetical protein